jgi:hypothetical protein
MVLNSWNLVLQKTNGVTVAVLETRVGEFGHRGLMRCKVFSVIQII